jgi:type I restriction enzyme R subunit
MGFRLAVWFMQVYGDWDFKELEYQEPTQVNIVDEKELNKLSATLF